MRNVKQPSETKVRDAMIWSKDSYMEYIIKSGGDCQSDNSFESLLKVTIAHPKTGNDTDVVIMKKYSKEFKDVLITESEINSLYNLCKTKKEKISQREDRALGALKLLYEYKENGKISTINKSGNVEVKPPSKKTLSTIEATLYMNSDIYPIIEKTLESWIKIKMSNVDKKLTSDSSMTTEQYQLRERESLVQLREFSESIISNFT